MAVHNPDDRLVTPLWKPPTYSGLAYKLLPKTKIIKICPRNDIIVSWISLTSLFAFLRLSNTFDCNGKGIIFHLFERRIKQTKKWFGWFACLLKPSSNPSILRKANIFPGEAVWPNRTVKTRLQSSASTTSCHSPRCLEAILIIKGPGPQRCGCVSVLRLKGYHWRVCVLWSEPTARRTPYMPGLTQQHHTEIWACAVEWWERGGGMDKGRVCSIQSLRL